MKKLNYYPTELNINKKTFVRTGLLHSDQTQLEKEKETYKKTHYVRTFWTGGEKLSNNTIRKSYFLLICKK